MNKRIKSTAATAGYNCICELCGCQISPGSQYYKEAWIDENKDYQTFCSHLLCNSVAEYFHIRDSKLDTESFKSKVYDYLKETLSEKEYNTIIQNNTSFEDMAFDPESFYIFKKDYTYHHAKKLVNTIYQSDITVEPTDEFDYIHESMANDIKFFEGEFGITKSIMTLDEINFIYMAINCFQEKEQLISLYNVGEYISKMPADDVIKFAKDMDEKFRADDELCSDVNYLSNLIQIINLILYIPVSSLYINLNTLNDKFDSLSLPVKLIIAYYLNKHQYIKPNLKHITYDNVYNIVHHKTSSTDEIEQDLRIVHNNIQTTLKEYEKKLFDVVYNVMQQNNLYFNNLFA